MIKTRAERHAFSERLTRRYKVRHGFASEKEIEHERYERSLRHRLENGT